MVVAKPRKVAGQTCSSVSDSREGGQAGRQAGRQAGSRASRGRQQRNIEMAWADMQSYKKHTRIRARDSPPALGGSVGR